MANPTPQYVWNERSARFRDVKTGRYISQSRVTAALNDVIDAAAAEMKAASVGLQTGQITLAQWQLVMEANIKNMHLASASMAKGGWNQLTQADFGRIGSIIKQEYGFLRKFALEISSGKQPLNGTFLQRAQEYMRAGKVTYYEVLKREKEKRLEVYVRNARHARDSCPLCIEQERLGYVRTDDPRLIPPGRRTCRGYCKCEWIFSTAEEAGIVEAA
jgi:hypothetical protein